jgi:hypothetical protein
MGKLLIPKIHHMDNVRGVIVFCYNIDEHKKWTKDYEKVKLVTNDFKEAL